jgi:2-deoxy-D-gluconate 3-dehydrogenase
VSSYCAAKAAVINLTRVLALEWARYDVQANCVAPGYVATQMNEAVRSNVDLRERISAKRFGEVSEIASVVAFLAEPESSFVTGECIVADGGQLARA